MAESWDQFLVDIQQWGTDIGVKFLIGLVVLILGLIVCRIIKAIVRRIMKRTNRDETVENFIISLIDVLLKIVVLISALATMGINTASIITVLGTCGVAIGLALKDSLGNIASGIIIIVNETFKKGDYIEVNGQEGIVQTINLFNTTLLTFDNVEVVIPNGIISTNSVKNYTAMDLRRVDLTFKVASETDLRFAQDTVFAFIDAYEKVIDTPEPVCRIDSFTDTGVVLVVRAWCKTDDYWDVHFDLKEGIRAQFMAKGIAGPYQAVTCTEKKAD